MNMRLFRLMLRLFPAEARAARGDEMFDALAEAPPGRLVRESRSLLSAAAQSWVRHLRTAGSVRTGLWLGAMLWLGFIAGIGPIFRITSIANVGPDVFGWTVDVTPFVVAAVLIGFTIVGIAVLPRRSTAWVTAPVAMGAVIFAALSIRVGQWGLPGAVLYELRWLGFSILAALVLKPKKQVRLVGLVAGGLGIAMSFLAWSFGEHIFGGHNYAWLMRNLWQDLGDELGRLGTLGSGLTMLAVLAIIVTPYVMPALATLAVPAVLHIVVVSPRDGAVLIGYLGTVALWHVMRTHLRVSISAWPPAIAIGPKTH